MLFKCSSSLWHWNNLYDLSFPSNQSSTDLLSLVFIIIIIIIIYYYYILLQNKYRAKGVEAFKEYSVVTDTPVYETAKLNSQNLSDVSNCWNVLNKVGFLLSIFPYITF